MMEKFLPDMYQKDIYSVNYDKLKNKDIKLLVFDFDNTIVDKKGLNPDKKLIAFFQKLKKSFNVIVISNTLKSEKIVNFCTKCDLKFVRKALKPLKSGYKRINKEQKYESSSVAAIGDQLLTDIWGAKRMGYFTILVDPIGIDDTSFTKINRIVEVRLYQKLKQKFNFEKGKYYD